MQPWHAILNRRSSGRVLAWSALVAIALVLAMLLQTLAAGALVETGRAAPTATSQSPAGAALADGDDVRARFLASLPTQEPQNVAPTGP